MATKTCDLEVFHDSYNNTEWWELRSSDGEVLETTVNPQTKLAWEHFTQPIGAVRPLSPGEFAMRFPKCELRKMHRVALYCKDGMIRPR